MKILGTRIYRILHAKAVPLHAMKVLEGRGN
jgi:hypothetical protein